MNNLKETDLVGKEFLKSSDIRPIEGYFNCLKSIKPLLEEFDSDSSTPGFYINISGGLNMVRLTYFTNNAAETKKKIVEFLKNNSNLVSLPPKDFRAERFEEPQECNISEGYGGEELRFRNFLSIYTHIGLDLLDYNILYSRRLVAEYRLTYSPQKITPKPLFEPAFAKHSKFFNQLDRPSTEQLWKDLNFWHPIPRNFERVADWTHFLVNMLLPGDYLYVYKELFTNPEPRPPILGTHKQLMLESFKIDMPDNWGP